MLQIHHAIPIPPDSLSTLSVLSEKVFSLSANGQRRTKFKPKPNRRGASLMTKYCRRPRDNAAAHAKYLASCCVVAPLPTVSVEGLCLRALREHMIYLSALFCCTLTAMDACYSQFSTSARPSFRRSRCPPTALCLRAPKPGIPPKTPLYLYCIDTLQGFSGTFRDSQGHLGGSSGQ